MILSELDLFFKGTENVSAAQQSAELPNNFNNDIIAGKLYFFVHCESGTGAVSGQLEAYDDANTTWVPIVTFTDKEPDRDGYLCNALVPAGQPTFGSKFRVNITSVTGAHKFTSGFAFGGPDKYQSDLRYEK